MPIMTLVNRRVHGICADGAFEELMDAARSGRNGPIVAIIVVVVGIVIVAGDVVRGFRGELMAIVFFVIVQKGEIFNYVDVDTTGSLSRSNTVHDSSRTAVFTDACRRFWR